MPAKQETESKLQNENAFKLWINKDVLVRIAKQIALVFPEFDQKKFAAIAPKLDLLELKPRVLLVRDQLRTQLPQDYLPALEILLKSTRSKKLQGFTLWPYTDFIQTFGLEHRAESLDALSELTALFTAEFAVRPFLKKETAATLAYLKKAATSNNEHVRRWSSEGSRPRLPWGERLDVFVQKPELTLEILELLKNDGALYVRKSVANHLNDISKDHPALVVATLRRWAKETKVEHATKIAWITCHALRTLIKKGEPGALSAIGVSSKAQVKVSKLDIGKKKFKIGDRIEFAFHLHSLANNEQRVVVDYIIHFMKSSGATAPKVFKLKALKLGAGAVLKIDKRHHLKIVTTRRFYPGAHAIEIQVNGIVRARADWILA